MRGRPGLARIQSRRKAALGIRHPGRRDGAQAPARHRESEMSTGLVEVYVREIEVLGPAAEDTLLAREAHFPATIADLCDPEAMPENLRAAHDRNDETLERIYIGRRFKNDTELLEKLFELYTKMTAAKDREGKPAKRGMARTQATRAGPVP